MVKLKIMNIEFLSRHSKFGGFGVSSDYFANEQVGGVKGRVKLWSR